MSTAVGASAATASAAAATATAGATGTATPGAATESATPKVVVFGGNGFVGQAVCHAALSLGCDVVSVSRRGQPDPLPEWGDRVIWARGDIFKPEEYNMHLQGAEGVVSCVGAFGPGDYMERICGDATVVAAEAAAAQHVPHFVFISAAGTGRNQLVLQGYYRGKLKAEQAIQRLFPDSGTWLRPGAIHGDRTVKGVTVPLGLVMKPLAAVLNLAPFAAVRDSPLEAALTPPVDVQSVGTVAALAAVGRAPAGVLSVDDINRLAAQNA